MCCTDICSMCSLHIHLLRKTTVYQQPFRSLLQPYFYIHIINVDFSFHAYLIDALSLPYSSYIHSINPQPTLYLRVGTRYFGSFLQLTNSLNARVCLTIYTGMYWVHGDDVSQHKISLSTRYITDYTRLSATQISILSLFWANGFSAYFYRNIVRLET